MEDGGYLSVDGDYFYSPYSLSFTSSWKGDKSMTRKRYLELVKVAKELCEFLEMKGIKNDEGCKVRKLAEELWEMK